MRAEEGMVFMGGLRLRVLPERSAANPCPHVRTDNAFSAQEPYGVRA